MGTEDEGVKAAPAIERSSWSRIVRQGRDIVVVGAGLVILVITCVFLMAQREEAREEARLDAAAKAAAATAKAAAATAACQALHDLAEDLLQEPPGSAEQAEAQEMLDSGLGDPHCTMERYRLKSIAAGDYSPGGVIFENRPEEAGVFQHEPMWSGRPRESQGGDSGCAERIAAISDLDVDAQSKADMIDAIRMDCGSPPLQQDEYWQESWEEWNG